MDSLNATKLNQHLTLRSDFTDFEHFQGAADDRAGERARFINDEMYVPAYTYPRLAELAFKSDIVELKSKLLEASFALGEIKQIPEVKLQVDYIHSELARIALTEAARNMQVTYSSAAYETSSEAFRRRNIEAYGEFDYELSLSMIYTEVSRVVDTKYERAIQDELLDRIGYIGTDVTREPELLDPFELKALHRFVMDKYASSFNLVPNTGDNVRYDAEQCKRILDAVMLEDGLVELGWKSVISSEFFVPATYPSKKTIYLPVELMYTADEIRRILVGHEIKTHAWRYENGLVTANQILEEGTATSTDIEEGLGILIECAISGNLDNPSLDRARDRYITAGLALGADGIERDAREVYEILWRMLVLRKHGNNLSAQERETPAKQTAYTHVENAFRGTSFSRKGVIYTKLKIYYEGLVKNAAFFRERMDNLDGAFETAFYGRYDHTSESERRLFGTH